MESKDTKTELMAIGAEAPSNYQTASRSETLDQTHSQAVISPTGVMNPVSSGVFGLNVQKKMGRPRKYGIDGNVSKSCSPMPISASAPPSIGGYPSGKRGRGRRSLEVKQQLRFETVAMGGGFEHSNGANFTPHVITINVGEDITAKIISFCQRGPRAICILSANGMLSNATLRQSDSSGGTLTYEGRFEIVNLCGSFIPIEREGTMYRAGGLSVTLSSPNGQVVGGCVAGLLIASSPVQIIVGSFLPTDPPELKPKKPKTQPPSPRTPFTMTKCNVQGQSRNNYQQENHMLEGQTSPMDINLSLPGG